MKIINYYGRLHFVDFLRGVAILLVVLIHLSQFYTQIFNFSKYGYLGVQIFFILSGFVLPLSMKDNQYKVKYFFKFLFKRIIRLEIPYFFALIISILFLYLKKEDNNWTNLFLSNLTYTAGVLNMKWASGVFWTLGIEFQFYFFLALLYLFFFNHSRYIFITIFLTILFISYFVKDGNILFYWFPFFGLGIILFRYKSFNLDINTLCFLSLITLILIFVKYGIPYLLISILTIAFIFINFYFNLKLSSNFIVKIGKISYSIYLVHLLIIQLFFYFFKIKGIGNSEYFTMTICILFVLVFSFLFYLLFEKYSKKLSHKIQYI